MDAWVASVFAGRLAGAGDLYEVSRVARSAPPPAGVPRPSDLLLDGLAVLVIEGRAAAAPLLGQAALVFAGGEISIEERVRWANSGRDGRGHAVGRGALAHNCRPRTSVLP